MRWYRGIGARIFGGFGLFIAAVALLFSLTASTVSQHNALLTRSGTLDLALGHAVQIDLDLAEVQLYTQLIARVRNPTVRMTAHSGLDERQERMPPALRALTALENDSTQIEALAVLAQNLLHLNERVELLQAILPQAADPMQDFENFIEGQELLDNPGGSGDIQTDIRSSRDLLQSLQGSLRAEAEEIDRHIESQSQRLGVLVQRIALAVLILGLLIAFGVTRSIRTPVKRLRARLLYLSRGVDREFPVEHGSDEIGEMARALDRLADGLRSTREFTSAVGEGNFEADYEPLSEDDVLGQTLLQMRDSLSEYEQSMEAKVQVRTQEIERLYTDLTDSIDYAQRIQGAIFPSAADRRSVFDRHFVMYMPRDGVSGDFPWFHKLGAWRMFAAVDCTGHGVPGAFMSLLGHNALGHISKVYTAPNKILDRLNQLGREALGQDQDPTEKGRVPDGMDVGMFSVNLEDRVLEYAGAGSAGYIVRKGEIIQLRPDKRAIGSFAPGSFHYNVQKVDLEEGDMVYAATDGFVDQFGGPKGRKFMRKRFRELLLEIAPKPVDEQQQQLKKVLLAWMEASDEEQVDDVMVIGVRIRL
jgi:serine phosphatase RsbU (regulator of sigma subunit)